MSTKRKHKTLTLTDKMDIINKLESGENCGKLANEYGVGRATIYDLRKQKQKFVDHMTSMEFEPGKRKTLRIANCPEMENALYTWYLKERSKHTPVSGDILKVKAIELYKEITNKNDFRGSDGWLEKFKKRFGISLSTTPSEMLPNNESKLQQFTQHFKNKVAKQGFLPDQIYNAAETALLWRLLPNKRFESSKEESAPGRKVIEDRIIFMPCSNANGTHKLDLLVVGETKNPTAFKDICLPVCYKNQYGGLITGEVFKEWFHKDFVPEVTNFLKTANLPIKALLVHDNASGHLNEQELISSDGNIETIYIPSNIAPLLQPMSQNVILKIKAFYKNKLLIRITQGGDITQNLKKMNLKDVVFFLAHAWSSVSTNLIQSSWEKLWPTINIVSQKTKGLDSENVLPGAYWLKNLSERGFETSAEDLNCWFEGMEESEQDMIDEEIGEVLEEKCSAEVFKSSTTTSVKVKPETVYNCFNTCITWAEENGISANDIVVLRNLQEKVFNRDHMLRKNINK